jgi:hypothetical protein
MADETYRPQRKSIDMKEINNPQENQAALNEMAAFRAKVEAETENGVKPEISIKSNDAMKISGHVPPQLKQALAQRKNPKSESQPEMRVVGSEHLEELIKGIQGSAIYETVKLPSNGIFYDGEDGPTDGIIHLRPMTGEEEQILATPRFVKKGQAINMIFNRCMKENYDSQNFLTQDRTYLLIYLRGISYSPNYDVEIRDPETDQMFATVIDLNSLFVDYCPADFSQDNLVDKLPTTGYKFSYRLARGSDEQSVQGYRERRVKNFDTVAQADDTLLYRTAMLLNDIEGLTDKTEIQTLLKKLPINDVAYLRTVINEPPFGVETKVSVTSPYSLQEFEIELPLEANFFFPRARRTREK